VQRGQAAFPKNNPGQIPAARESIPPKLRQSPTNSSSRTPERPLGKVRRIDKPKGLSREEKASLGGVSRKSRIPGILFLLAILVILVTAVLYVLSMTGIVGLGSIDSLLKPLKSEEKQQETTPAPTTQTPVETVEPSEQSSSATNSDFSQETPLTDSPPQQEESSIVIDPEVPGSPNPELPPSQDEEEPTEAIPTLPPDETFREGETPLPSDLQSDSSADTAQVQQALQAFLGAPNFETRAKYLPTTALHLPGIRDSIFARSWPKPNTIRFLKTAYDLDEARNDFFFIVGWDGTRDSPSRPVTVELHRWHPDQTPRIHAEAFLEAYEEALSRYANTPQSRSARFHVMGRCIARCFRDIPDASSKATLKLASFPGDLNAPEAFFSKTGDLMSELKERQSGAAMQQEIPMTVTLAWSPEDVKPRYLELIRIDAFDWHP
jgi:hypothetical protein